MAAYCLCHTYAEFVARCVCLHLAYIAANEQHGIATIAHRGTMAALGLRCATINNGYKIICDDDPVLAFLRGVFRYDALLYYFHI